VAFLTFTFALGGTALAIINSGGGGLIAGMVVPLFDGNGNIQTTQASTILANMNAGRTQILNRDIEFRLFTQAGSGDVQTLSNLGWRMTHINGDRITFWASGAYRNSQFNMQPSAASHNYANSTLRSNVLGNFGTLTSAWTPAVRDANILTQGTTLQNANTNDRMWIPSAQEVQASGTWGLTQGQRAYAANGNLGNAWLRSSVVAGTASSTPVQAWRERHRNTSNQGISHYSDGLWTTNQASLRSIGTTFIITNESDYGWYTWGSGQVVSHHTEMRSQTMGTFGSANTIASSGLGPNTTSIGSTSGSFEWHWNVFPASASVRPALHVSLAALNNALNPPLPAPTATRNDTMLSWNAVTGAGSYGIYRDGVRVTTTTATSIDLTDAVFGTWPVTGNRVMTVRAIHPTNAAQNSALSTGVTITFSRLATPVISIIGNTLSWPAIPGTTSYHVILNGSVSLPITSDLSGSFGFSATIGGGGVRSVNLLNLMMHFINVVPDTENFTITLEALGNGFNVNDSLISNSLSFARPLGPRMFVTSINLMASDTMLMNDLFPTQIEYREHLRVGDWVMSAYGAHMIFRQIDAIAGGANPTVTLGAIVGNNPGEGLAELVSYALDLSLERADFATDGDWNTFTDALFNAENAIYFLDPLSPAEIMVYADILRAALALRV